MNELFIYLLIPALIINILLRFIQHLANRHCLSYMGGGTWKSKIMNAFIIFIASALFLIYYSVKFDKIGLDPIIITYLLVSFVTTGIQLILDIDTFGQYNKDLNLFVGEGVTVLFYVLWYYIIIL